ncbi:hypothetical protein [Oceanivirga salmonicida]|uniref:hypothetical protein n=1 Tax=Oceanivirga salmonicida TaxID=1769291 RepID=UPI00082AB18C|nr:hypothetical protein [Oceanivirga salmonicida]
MKKIFFILLFSLVSNLFALNNNIGEINLKAGVIFKREPDLNEPYNYWGTAYSFVQIGELEYLYPVYRSKNNEIIKIGGGLQTWFQLYDAPRKNTQKSAKISISPIFTAVIEKEIKENLSIYGGVSVGAGPHLLTVFKDKKQNKKGSITVRHGFPLYGKFGVKYNNFIIESQAGVYIAKYIREVDNINTYKYIANVGVLFGYSF